MSRRIYLIFRMNFPNFQCNSIVLFLLCFRICYKGTICILFPFSKQQMKSFSTFCQPLKGNRGVVCTVTPSTDPHTGLAKEYVFASFFCTNSFSNPIFEFFIQLTIICCDSIQLLELVGLKRTYGMYKFQLKRTYGMYKFWLKRTYPSL